jgi:hypothetical protein
MPTIIDVIWQQAAIVALLLIVVYTGHKGYWYWSPGVRALTTELARDRDDWRTLAVTMMRKQGIELPEGFEQAQGVALPGDPLPQHKR